MGFFADKWEEASRRLAALLQPHLAAGEILLGVVHANQQKLFSAELYAVGVTAERLILLPIDRKMEARGEPVSITRDQVTSSAVWGWGGSLADFLSGSAEQQVRFSTAETRFKLMILGGNLVENALAGPSQKSGLEALLELLRSAKR